MRVRTVILIVVLLSVCGMASAQNLVPQPTFPSTYLTPWTDFAGTWTHATGAGNDTNGGDGSGECTATEGVADCIIMSGCISVATSTTYGYGIKMKHGGNVTGLTMRAMEHTSGDCTDGMPAAINTQSTPNPDPGWTTHNSTATTGAGAGSVQISFTMTATFGSGNTINTNLDWGFFGLGMVPVEIQSFTVE